MLGMPAWLANTTSGWCNDTSSCSPTNYDSWGKVVVAYARNLTNNFAYPNCDIIIEEHNEPQGSGWLNNLSYDNSIKATEYVKLFNATYVNMKSNNSNIKVIGLGGIDIAIDSSNIATAFFSNISQADGYSLHYYYNTYSGSQSASNITAKINNYIDLCNLYSQNYCNNSYINEFNTYNLGSIAFTQLQSISTASIYQQLISMPIKQSALYLWSSQYKNASCDSSYNYSLINQQNNQYNNGYGHNNFVICIHF
jgi:hypothetical protein